MRSAAHAGRFRDRDVAQIEHHHAKASALQQQISDLQHLFQRRAERKPAPVQDFPALRRRIVPASRLAGGNRTHSNRSRSTPAAAAEAGSKLSLASTSAQASWRRVAPASAASITPVRPEEAGPVISLSASARQSSGKRVERSHPDGHRQRRSSFAQ